MLQFSLYTPGLGVLCIVSVRLDFGGKQLEFFSQVWGDRADWNLRKSSLSVDSFCQFGRELGLYGVTARTLTASEEVLPAKVNSVAAQRCRHLQVVSEIFPLISE